MPLSAHAISKRYQQNWALKDVTIEVSPGRVFGICGPSGSGKSTLMRIFAGLEQDFSGRLSIDEKPFSDRSEAVLFSAVSHRRTSWLDRLLGKDDEEKAELSDLERPPLNGKRIVLLDEALCGQSPAERTDRISQIRKNAVTGKQYLILATSDFRDVLEFCDECVLLKAGVVVQSGTPEETYASPRSAAAAEITGRMNIIEARRVSSSKAEIPKFQTIKGSHQLSIAKSDLSSLGPINQNVMLCIRPEHISISFGASFPEDNLLKAVIVDWKFLGPSTLVRLDSNGLRIEALVMRLVGLKPGDECMIGMPPERISILLN